ncbi:hypothetical protein BCV69DRAFT_285648 [Microstroma glucosiphilum]|uniref:Histone deacetylase interacting domain-containing protein n=1 Tax=Pseudomicrostroma glucosiphilum TaxID=1684307 RepID=A0A316TYH3_9BASI|nr:hypothetical protein BCV69DRAFT_285648 [Pseudomicrostroma glucosiphilum]PWN17764.1 hypothetical protein BCV69DRAFT_285648 [Pseudomicrostroma glucosiphilum]
MASLNVKDALSYLDQVKLQFAEQPDVYNRFLDIMKDFKSQSIDTPGVIERVSTLFRGHPSLIQGFNTFLPPGYRIECSMDPSESNLITVTTPSGTTTQKEGAKGIAGAVRQGAAQAASSASPNSGAGAAGLAGPAPPKTERTSISGGSSGVAANIAAQAPRLPSQPAPSAMGPSGIRPGSPHRPSIPGIAGGITAPSPATPGAAAGAGVLSQSAGLPPHMDDPSRQPLGPGGPGADAAGNARTPLEFNHAINYVNKIKQRFSNDPETYKQFLEILQTYQKEGRAIQDVYAQVTILFDGAPDLLDEFKQFLPDTSADQPPSPVSAPSAMLGGGGIYALGQATQSQAVGRGPNVQGGSKPPAQPAASSSRAKKRAAQDVPAASSSSKNGPPAQQSGRAKKPKHGHKAQTQPERSPPPHTAMIPIDQVAAAYGLPPAAIQQLSAAYGTPDGMIPVEAAAAAAANAAAGLVPSNMVSAGIPLGPAYAPLATLDEVAFFDRVKKHIDDRNAYLDFLKLLNLYTQDVIDVRTLVDKAAAFIGGHRDLFATFKSLCGYEMGRHGWLEEEEAVIENTPALERPRIDLSTCELYGASYRRLPKEEVSLSCSGRDDMCWEVLNDEWVCHPTWASEGEGFNPHKKNIYEDALYRSEEERHEYDYHIEANLRTIALLEPIAARIAAMDESERANFRLKPGLGGQSRSIYQRVLRKIYGRDAGAEIVAALHDSPSTSIPVVLARLRQKDEEWKRAQREWNKVWRVVDERNWWKSLDHRGVTWKTLDKKAMTTRGLVGEIELRRAEDVSRRYMKELGAPRSLLGTDSGSNVKGTGDSNDLPSAGPWHLEYDFSDRALVYDVIKLALSHLDRGPSYSRGDIDRIEVFLRSFLPLLFGEDAKQWEDEMGLDPVVGDDDEEGGEASDAHKARRNDDLRMKVLRGQVGEGDAAVEMAKESSSTLSTMEQTWIRADTKEAFDSVNGRAGGAANGTASASSAADASSSSSAATPKTLNFFCTTSHYAYLRLFQLAYSRLGKMKRLSAELGRELDEKNQQRKARGQKSTVIRGNPAALRLGLQDRWGGVGAVVGGAATASDEEQPHTNGATTNGAPQLPSAPISGWELHPSKYYPALLDLIEKLFDGDSIDQNMYEECIRFMFGIEGYVVFTIDKVLGGLVKMAQSIISDTKCAELQSLLHKDRSTRGTQSPAVPAASTSPSAAEQRDAQAKAYRHQIAMRMSAECLVGKEESLFRVGWTPVSSKLGIQMLSRDDPSADLPPYVGVGLSEGEADKAREERWLYYISSFALWAPTEGLMGEAKGPYLKRSVANALKADRSLANGTPGALGEGSADDVKGEEVASKTSAAATTSAAAAAAGSSTGSPASPASSKVKFLTESGLEVKVCLSTYRLFFVSDTEDAFARVRLQGEAKSTQAGSASGAAVKERRRRKFEGWLEGRRAALDGDGDEVVAEAEVAGEEPAAPSSSSAPAPPAPAAVETEPLQEEGSAQPAESTTAAVQGDAMDVDTDAGVEPTPALEGSAAAGVATDAADGAPAAASAVEGAEGVAEPAATTATEAAAAPGTADASTVPSADSAAPAAAPVTEPAATDETSGAPSAAAE